MGHEHGGLQGGGKLPLPSKVPHADLSLLFLQWLNTVYVTYICAWEWLDMDGEVLGCREQLHIGS